MHGNRNSIKMLLAGLALYALLVLSINISNSEATELHDENAFLCGYGEQILNRLSNLNNTLEQIVECREFFDKLGPDDLYSNFGVELAYIVNNLKSTYSDNKDLEYVINNLPREITTIPWGESISIYNNETKQYICASYHGVYSTLDVNENCFWNFKIEANGRYLTIQNTANKRYMCATDIEVQSEQIIAMIEGTSNIRNNCDKWQFQPQRNYNKPVYEYGIKNYMSKEYITGNYSANIFLTKPSHRNSSLCRWRFTNGWRKPLPGDRAAYLSYIYGQYTGNSDIAKIILKNANNSPTSRITEYSNLFELMKTYAGFYSVEGMILDYNVQTLLTKYPSDVNLLKMNEYFRTLWKPFPWDSKITIQNQETEKYLCARFDLHIYLKVKLQNKGKNCYWKFQIDSSGFFFRIIHFPGNKYFLIVPNKNKSNETGSPTIIPRNKIGLLGYDKWEWRHERTEHHVIQLQNIFWDETLYSYSLSQPSTRDDDCRWRTCTWLIETY